MSAIPIAGIPLGAAESAEREVKSAKTGNPIDELQAQLSAAGQIPAVGIVPDLVNSAIDMWRSGIFRSRAVRGAQRALQQQWTTP